MVTHSHTPSTSPPLAPTPPAGHSFRAIGGIIGGCLLLGLLLRALPMPYLGKQHFLMPFLPAVLAGAWYGGPRWGWLAILISIFLEIACFPLPYSRFAMVDAGGFVRVGVFLGIGGALSLLIPRFRQHCRNVETQAHILQALTTASPLAILMLDNAGTIRHRNPEADFLFKQSIFRLLEWVTPECQSCFQTLQQAALQGSSQPVCSLDFRRPDGSCFTANVWVAPWRSNPLQLHGTLVILADVTEQKQNEMAREQLLHQAEAARAAAEASRQRLQFLADASDILAGSLDYTSTLISIAHLAVPVLADYCVIDLVDLDAQWQRVAVVHADPSKQLLVNQLRAYAPNVRKPDGRIQAYQTGQPVLVRTVTPDRLETAAQDEGHRELLRQLEARSLLIVPLVARGRVHGVITLGYSASGRHYGEAELALGEELARRAGLAIDSARLYQATRDQAEQLKSKQEHLELILRATNEVVWDWELARNHMTWSDALREQFGYRTEEVESTFSWWASRVHPDERDRVVKGLMTFVIGQDEGWAAEYRFLRADGTYAYVLDRGRAIRDTNGKALRMVGAVLDLSEHRALEEQLRQSQKMEAIGRLAGGIAHDFNNMLGVIVGYAEFLQQHAPQYPERVLSGLREIERAGRRAAKLTRQLLTFSHRQPTVLQAVDLNAVLSDMEDLLRRLLGEDILLTCHPEPKLPSLQADPTQLEQVILNLAINARDAMPRGGRLTLTTTTAASDAAAFLHLNHPRPGNQTQPVKSMPAEAYVCLTVTDTGCGIDPEIQPRIFEPFFTTKSCERGSGLGLSTVYGIVRQSGGHIEVDSQPGQGSTFRLYLPQAITPAGPRPVAPRPAPLPVRGTETVLVAEDEPMVRDLARRILTAHGYHVLTAEDGASALQLCERYPETIHLLVTDVVMPRHSGPELAERARRRRPDLKVLFVSGYGEEVVDRHGDQLARNGFLAKPFTPHTLLHAVLRQLHPDSPLAPSEEGFLRLPSEPVTFQATADGAEER